MIFAVAVGLRSHEQKACQNKTPQKYGVSCALTVIYAPDLCKRAPIGQTQLLSGKSSQRPFPVCCGGGTPVALHPPGKMANAFKDAGPGMVRQLESGIGKAGKTKYPVGIKWRLSPCLPRFRSRCVVITDCREWFTSRRPAQTGLMTWR